MYTTFTCAERTFLTSESVTEGHPDKVCDQISDAILDYIIADDPRARVACEAAVTTGLVVVLGEITTKTYCPIEKVVRETIRQIGYRDGLDRGFDADSCGVIVSVKEQSPNIAMGVNREKPEEQGAGDQGMMIGFACNETPEYMPMTIALAHRLCRQLAALRKDGTLSYLRPDGKSQVTVEYCRGKPARVDAIVVSAHHCNGVSQEQIKHDVKELVIKPVIPADMLDTEMWKHVHINPTGCFEVGGPMGDTGVTGRKIIVDTYGGVARHGGGCFSGKDPSKVDRSAAYMARYIAKNLVAAGIADRLELQVSYAIGVAEPVSLAVETFGTGRIGDEDIVKLVRDNFDMRPAAIIRDLNLLRPIYKPTAAYGHFGRDDIDAPWERTDKVDVLRRQAGL
ncbi:MAG: methionine adenosyltransferase [Anaerolineae bacterium]